MIPNNLSTHKVFGTLSEDEIIRMTFDEDSLPHLMLVLTNMYSDQELACIREYSTNAHDSHLDAGQTRPIEVETPGYLSPFLRIRDYGVGMNKDTIRQVYSKYGASTKREQVNTNGSMGLGSKAALTYTSQFTVVGVKGGIKTTVSVSMSDEGDPIMQVLEEAKTDDPNGVEITIPTKSFNDFERKAKALFQFWKPGTVLLNGSDPAGNLRKLSDRIYFHDGERDVVVMGNVPYPIDSEHRISGYNQPSIAAFVTMGGSDQVVFTPAREGLIYGSRTMKALEGIHEEYNEVLHKQLQAEIDGQPNIVCAWEASVKYGNWYGFTFTYKGRGIAAPGRFTVTDSEGIVSSKRGIRWYKDRSRNSVESGSTYDFKDLHNAALVITGYMSDSVSSAYKARIKQYLREHAASHLQSKSRVILVKDTVLGNPEWTSHLENVVSWPTIVAKTKVARTISSGTGGMGGKYEVMPPGENSFIEDFLSPKDEVYFFSPKDSDPRNSVIFDRLRKERPKAKVVRTPANRHGKILKTVKKSQPLDLNALAAKYAKADFDALTPDQLKTAKVRVAYSAKYDHGLMLGIHAQMAVDKIADPEYAEALTALKDTQSYGLANRDPRWHELGKGVKTIDFSERYPLAASQWSRRAKSVTEYINLMYNARTNKGDK